MYSKETMRENEIKYSVSQWNPDADIINKSVSFTGHRPNKYNYASPEYEDIKHLAYRTIQDAMENGYQYFLMGGCSGFDLIAANYCLKLKEQFGYKVKIICILPYEDFYLSNHFNEFWRDFYIKLVNRCDYVINPSGSKQFLNNKQYMDRNKILVDYSNLLIAFNPLKHGGANNTVKYAHSKGIQVISLA